MTETQQQIVTAKQILDGEIQPDELTARYILLVWGIRSKEGQRSFIEAINFLAKFDWRAVGISHGWCLMERKDQLSPS